MTLKDRYKKFAPESVYHVFNRGVAKGNIFIDDQDYFNYLKRIKKFLTLDWQILCYVLMPNHVHFIIKQLNDNPVSAFIQSLHTSYVYYFNHKYNNRVGPLFQDRFKSRLVENDEYLIHLSRYIHLNPLISKLTKNINQYPWSSYLDYIGKRQGTICNKELILAVINNQGTVPAQARGLSPNGKYEQFVKDGIAYAHELKDAKEIAKLVDNCW